MENQASMVKQETKKKNHPGNTSSCWPAAKAPALLRAWRGWRDEPACL